MTKINATKDPTAGLSPHGYAFSIESSPSVLKPQEGDDAEDLNSQGVVLVTRYHKIFDGSFHFSIKALDNTTIVGA